MGPLRGEQRQLQLQAGVLSLVKGRSGRKAEVPNSLLTLLLLPLPLPLQGQESLWKGGRGEGGRVGVTGRCGGRLLLT